MEKKDPKGYYARLGVAPSATSEEIKAAYRRLAKAIHPDRNASETAKQRFQELNEAYQILGDPEARNSYDALQYASPKPEPSENLDPVCCSRCGKITAQPRATVFFYVISVVLLTFKRPIQGIFCSICARKAALKASLISGLAGWWGVPWGPIWTIGAIIKNAAGGQYKQEVDEKLAWYNALAFLSQGKLALSYALARQCQRASSEGISDDAVRLMKHLEALGVSRNSATLKNPWARRPLEALIHIAILGALPVGAWALVAMDNRQHPAQTASPSRAVYASPPTTKPSPSFVDETKRVSAPQAAIATCAFPPVNGKELFRASAKQEKGHVLTIKNGSGVNAIVKARDATTGRLIASFFVADNSSASLESIPDGKYRFQYALGHDLHEDCKTFVSAIALAQFPDIESFFAEVRGNQIIRQRLTYTLYAVAGGNIRPQGLDLKSFNAD